LDNENEEKLKKIFLQLTGNIKGEKVKIQVMSGRTIEIPYAAVGVTMFDFNELVDQPYGSIDFIAICRKFHSIIVTNVPMVNLDNRNATKRFILLIDEIYNHKVKLYVSAQTDITHLFVTKSTIITEEVFAIDRAKSRMIEMQSKKYLEEDSYYDEKMRSEAEQSQ